MIRARSSDFWLERARGIGYLVAVGLGVLAVAAVVATVMVAVMT
jgi:hypothetical protein